MLLALNIPVLKGGWKDIPSRSISYFHFKYNDLVLMEDRIIVLIQFVRSYLKFLIFTTLKIGGRKNKNCRNVINMLACLHFLLYF